MRLLSKCCLCLCLVGALLSMGLSAQAGDDNPKGLPTIKVVHGRGIDYLASYVGVEEGFFEEAGVHVELEYIKGEQNILAAVLRNDVQGGEISLASLGKLTEKDVPIKVVLWMGHAHSGTKCGIHVGSQTDYKTLKDVKGLRIATSGSINSKTMLRHAVALGGYEMKDIRPLWGGRPDNPMQHEAALRSGGIDAFIV